MPGEVVESPKSDMCMECAICTGPLRDPAIGGGCCHHFCYECYVEWCKRAMNCPTCRAPVWCLTRDFEYGEAIGSASSPSRTETTDDAPRSSENEPSSRVSTDPLPVDISVAWPPGITLANDPLGRGDYDQIPTRAPYFSPKPYIEAPAR